MYNYKTSIEIYPYCRYDPYREVTPTGVSYECYIYCNYNMNEFRVHFDQLNKI